MAKDQDFTWKQGPSKDDVILRTREGEDIAHIFPRDNKEGFTLLTRNHGEWWPLKGQHYDSLLAAQHHAIQHVERYYLQEKHHLQEAHRHHVLHDLQKEWERMGGDPKTMKKFKAEWDRVSAAEHHLKVLNRDDGHER